MATHPRTILFAWIVAIALGAWGEYRLPDATVGGAAGAYGGTSVTISGSRLIAKSMHVVAAFNANRYDSPNFSLYNRTLCSVRLGFGWTPGDVPLRVW